MSTRNKPLAFGASDYDAIITGLVEQQETQDRTLPSGLTLTVEKAHPVTGQKYEIEYPLESVERPGDLFAQVLADDTGTAARREHRCIQAPIGCGQPISGFRDALSTSEYRISGLCQACQDSVFGESEE